MAVVFQDPEWEMGEVIIIITIVPRSASVEVFPLLGSSVLWRMLHLSPTGISALSKAVTPSAWVLGEVSVLWQRLQKGCSGKASMFGPGHPGLFSVQEYGENSESRRKQWAAGYCIALSKDLVYCYGGQQRSTILAKRKCVKNLGPTRPPYLDLLTLWLSKPNLASQNWLMELVSFVSFGHKTILCGSSNIDAWET